MITCKSCQYQNLSGAIFCEGCAEALVAPNPAESALTEASAETQNAPLLLQAGKNSAYTHAPEDCWIALHILDAEETRPLTLGDEFTMGRISDDQGIKPDFDLAPYHALELGVSRYHLAVRRGLTGVLIKDLGSSNGTYLNGRRLQANVDETLHDRDVVSLSKLKIQVLLLDR